jgi:hypothetical protein
MVGIILLTFEFFQIYFILLFAALLSGSFQQQQHGGDVVRQDQD